MKSQISTLVFFVATMGFAQFGAPSGISRVPHQNGLVEAPEFYILEWKFGTQLKEKATDLTIIVDSLGNQKVNALAGPDDHEVLYTSDISTPVCADGECKLMHIRFYWTILGQYAGFDRYPNLPLTKNDHDEFQYMDYLKLHQLLMDDNSILKRRKMEELVKKPKQPKMEGVDAVAGATIKEIKESVVSGALYSCYTAWHIVHGSIKEEILQRTSASIDADVILNMLNSRHADYQLFALKRLDEKQYEENYARIADIFKSGIPLVRTFIIKNLPDSFWNSEKLQGFFWNSFSEIDINSRSLLLNNINRASPKVSQGLSLQLQSMTKNQLKIYLKHLEDSNRMSSSIKENLLAFANSRSETIAYLVSDFLEDYQ